MTNTSLVFSLFATLPAVFVVMVFILYCAVKSGKHRGDQRWDRMLAASVLIIPFSTFGMTTARFLSRLVPFKYDQYAFLFDARFGELSFVLGRLLAPHFWWQTVFAVVYNLLPCAFLSVYAVYLFKCTLEESMDVVRAYILLFLLIVPLYLLFPVAGPYYAFPGFPFDLPNHVVAHPILLDAAPNGVPSGHIAAALVTVFFLRRWRSGLILSSIFLLLTAVATLESGEHYVFDLIAAVPFSFLVFYVARHPRRRSADTLDTREHSQSLQASAD
ncbi:MAG TPA: phosphatase PAP2 family protein [Terracidiphilus sp.]|jgi:hypothetical protein